MLIRTVIVVLLLVVVAAFSPLQSNLRLRKNSHQFQQVAYGPPLSLTSAATKTKIATSLASTISTQDGETSKAQIPLKIAVGGAGIGGMFLGYALQRKGFEVTVFEKSKAFSRFGGPIQLASNALSCVNALSPELFTEIMGRFTFTGTRKCGIKDGIRNEWYSVFDAIKNLAEWNTLPYTGVIDRPDLQDVLLKSMRAGTVRNSQQINKYVENPGELIMQDCFI